MADNSNPLLLDAKREYSLRLAEIMSPFVIGYMDSTYASVIKNVGRRKSLMEFQKQLRTIPGWNSAVISDVTKAITSRYPYFDDLMAAVFVTWVKVLSSIKLSSARPNIKLKLPNTDAFVHQVYIASAKNFYENVDVMQSGDQTRKHHLVLDAIEVAVRALLPLGDVLQAYLSNAVDDERKTVNPVLSPIQSDDEHFGKDDDDSDPHFEDDASDDDEDNQEQFIALPSALPSPPPQQPPAAMLPPLPAPAPAPAPAFAPPPPPPPPTPVPAPTPSPPLSAHPVDPFVPSHPPPPPPAPLFSDAFDGGDAAFR